MPSLRQPARPIPPSQPVQPIAEDGTLLAEFPRGKPDPLGVHPETMRVSLKEMNGYPFIDLRLYFMGQSGLMLPTKKGITVRLENAEATAAAILEGLRLADREGGWRRGKGGAR